MRFRLTDRTPRFDVETVKPAAHAVGAEYDAAVLFYNIGVQIRPSVKLPAQFIVLITFDTRHCPGNAYFFIAEYVLLLSV